MPKNSTESVQSREAEMSSVQAFGTEDAATYAHKMVQWRSRGWGDETNALTSVGRECGMSPIALKRLIKGKRKDNGARVFPSVRAAYLRHCERLIAQVQAELDADKRKYGNAALADLEDKAAALVAELAARREALK